IFLLAATYALVGQERVALQLIKSSNLDIVSKKYDYYTYGSPDRNRPMALETFVLLYDKLKAQAMAKTLAQRLSNDEWMSTQSTSYSLLALAKFAGMIGGKGIQASISVNGADSTIDTQKTLANMGLAIKTGTNSINIKNTGPNLLY